ncbi:DUF1993 domain-containing protein [Leeia sp. TBRC 13508]|uniref:DUF1993 domain-containing protein n=1 Tax=Leeia speluncae TaxID=2884804 RepID=A0ABS8DAW0_9NEIS|nr:DUF1993 domain-containing protein [Leeia speluncae]MCB6185330.1 DUF1993 domain-containing protein [Leeia speluncae]
MSLSMYQASIPVFVRMLDNLSNLLTIAAQHAEKAGYDKNVLASSRLFPDMFPLSKQVQIATDMVKGAAARLSGETPPSWADTETTLEELLARVAKAKDYVSSFVAEKVDGSEQKEVILNWPTVTLNFNGQDYLLNFVLPNFYFHISTVYAILRANGVPVGKMDFLGAY